MSRSSIVAVLLLVGLLAGLCLEPDSGTAAAVGPPDISGLTVGANHAKPLPRVLTLTDILLLAAPALLVALLALHVAVPGGAVPERLASSRRSLLGQGHARRAPPAFA